jgi:hypothetical protein
MPRRLSRASVVRLFRPRSSVSSTGQSSHISSRCSTRRSTIRRATDFKGRNAECCSRSSRQGRRPRLPDGHGTAAPPPLLRPAVASAWPGVKGARYRDRRVISSQSRVPHETIEHDCFQLVTAHQVAAGDPRQARHRRVRVRSEPAAKAGRGAASCWVRSDADKGPFGSRAAFYEMT